MKERCSICCWLPILWFLYTIEALPLLLYLIIIAGFYEVRVRNKKVTKWSLIAYFHIVGLSWLLAMLPQEVWFVVMIAVVNDAAALFGGKYCNFTAFMRWHIFPMSPNKTLGGFIYGVAAGSAIGFYLVELFNFPHGYKLMIIPLCLASVIGDLIESKFKRVNKIKDSGEGLFTEKLLYGHGGIYCRFDALAFTCHVWAILTFILI